MGGVYERWMLPRLIDLAMRNKQVTRYRRRTIPAAAGRVLEIGAGSGLNLRFYGDRVQHLYALDPSARLLQMAKRKRPSATFPVEYLVASAEHIPMGSRSVDTVVSTWTLCSVPDAGRALREARRVLDIAEMTDEYLKGPRPMTYTYSGQARSPV